MEKSNTDQRSEVDFREEVLENASTQEPQQVLSDEQVPAEAAAEAEVAEDAVESVDPLEAARQEAATNHERYLRAVADFENYRRRMVREKEEARKYALAGFLEDVLPVLDNFYLGLEVADKQEETKSVCEGFNMVLQQLLSLVQQHGLEEVKALGETFDPNWHDCISQQPSEEMQEGVVLQVVRRGYQLNGRLLRPASVIVSSGKPAESAAEQ